MSEIKNIVDGFNAGYLIQQNRPELYKQLEPVLNEVELPFFNAFIKGGVESKEERLKSIMLGKNVDSPTIADTSKDDIDFDI